MSDESRVLGDNYVIGSDGRGVWEIFKMLFQWSGQGSSVGITTDFGLDGPGSNPSVDEILGLNNPAQGPIQSPVKWVPGLFRG